MKSSIIAVLIMTSFSVFSADVTEIMSSIHGTCTLQSCPPGTQVVVDAKEGDSGIATTYAGERYDLLSLRKIDFVVVQNSDKYSGREAVVKSQSGAEYQIEWMFLKKK